MCVLGVSFVSLSKISDLMLEMLRHCGTCCFSFYLTIRVYDNSYSSSGSFTLN